MTKHFTIGMSGHIDHGKTTLTKAMTGVDTDRLKEEKERQISIELGYAPLQMEGDWVVSIIDVPGHERFIRQMIAGVSGIDLVILVVAADEGVMPQTKEHLEILKFLQVQKGIVAITKKDKVDEDFLELVKEEIMEELEGTIFHSAPVLFVESIKKEGVEELVSTIKAELQTVSEKRLSGPFRLPIDQVFSIKGQGTIVRGTILEGAIQFGDTLEILPAKHSVKARQLQVHNKSVDIAHAGQRVAVNLPNINREALKRGDVLVHANTYESTSTIDVALQFVKNLQFPIKQRSSVKIHIGTSEVLGKLVLFDRNEISGETTEEVLCQIRLEEPIITKRGDKLIVRRPSPVETIGGGWVIQSKGHKYKFGDETVLRLKKMKQGSTEERIQELFLRNEVMTEEELQHEIGIDNNQREELEKKDILVKVTEKLYASGVQLTELNSLVISQLTDYHHKHPLKTGVPKAELLSSFSQKNSKIIIELVLGKLEEKGKVKRVENMLFLSGFQPGYPKQWKKRMEQIVEEIRRDALTPKPFIQICKDAGLPEKEAMDLRYYLISQEQAYELDERHLICVDIFKQAVSEIKSQTSLEIELSEVKEVLGLSRKYLIPFVELMDSLGITKRVEEKRIWR